MYCVADSGVYMQSEDLRQEYILNETGMIWAGTPDSKHIWYWNFAQVRCNRKYMH